MHHARSLIKDRPLRRLRWRSALRILHVLFRILQALAPPLNHFLAFLLVIVLLLEALLYSTGVSVANVLLVAQVWSFCFRLYHSVSENPWL